MKRHQKKKKPPPPLHERLPTAAAAKYLGIGESTLAQMRVNGGGPQFIKLAARVLYDTRDLDRWIESNKFTSTADYDRYVDEKL